MARDIPRSVSVPGRHAVYAFLLLVTASLLAVTTHASAGTERYGSVTVTVEQRDNAASGFGYGVFPVTVVNGSRATRTVTVRVPAVSHGHYGDHLSAVSRSFRVEPGATVRSELIHPALPVSGSDATVSIDGRRQDDRVSVNISGGYGHEQTALVRVSRDLTRRQRGVLDAAVQRHDDAGRSGGRGGYHSTRSGMPFKLQNAPPVGEWRGGWLTYSGYAEVVVSERDMDRASAQTSEALRDYVMGGGRLTVVSESRWPTPRGWPTMQAVDQPEGDAAMQKLGLGRVLWLDAGALADASEARADEWIDNATAAARLRMTRQSAEQADQSFPVVEGQRTPVRGLLAMMVVFALLIGPANILVLSLIKKRMWLLWTVPVGSALFSGAVIVFALLSEGITPSARTASVTLLDQTTREAVTRTLRGYYAPLTPGDGLHFGMDTLVTPQVDGGSHYGSNGRTRTMDLTRDQHLQRGWVTARVPAHLKLTSVQSRRERLDFERLDDGSLAVVNGLGVDVERLSVTDGDGRLYSTMRVPAGDRVVLIFNPVGQGTIPPSAERAASLDQFFGDVFAVQSGTKKHGPNSYWAELAATPFVEDGLDGIGEHRIDAAVIGRWKEGR